MDDGDKRRIKNKDKKYLKIHIAVNVKIKKILSIKVTTDEYVHDSKPLPGLVENIIKSDKIIDKLFADYNEIFGYLRQWNLYFDILK
jgi:hypothetical protein